MFKKSGIKRYYDSGWNRRSDQCPCLHFLTVCSCITNSAVSFLMEVQIIQQFSNETRQGIQPGFTQFYASIPHFSINAQDSTVNSQLAGEEPFCLITLWPYSFLPTTSLPFFSILISSSPSKLFHIPYHPLTHSRGGLHVQLHEPNLHQNNTLEWQSLFYKYNEPDPRPDKMACSGMTTDETNMIWQFGVDALWKAHGLLAHTPVRASGRE